MYHDEYKHGYVSGLLHGQPIPNISHETTRILYAENIDKVIDFAPSSEYWRGYSHGLIGFGARQRITVGAMK